MQHIYSYISAVLFFILLPILFTLLLQAIYNRKVRQIYIFGILLVLIFVCSFFLLMKDISINKPAEVKTHKMKIVEKNVNHGKNKANNTKSESIVPDSEDIVSQDTETILSANDVESSEMQSTDTETQSSAETKNTGSKELVSVNEPAEDVLTNAAYNDYIWADGTIDVKLFNKLCSQLTLVPEKLISRFKAENWKFYITDRDIGQFMFNGAKGVCGGTSTYESAIYISNTDHAINTAAIHEFGHFLDYLTYTSFDSSDFVNAYTAEKSELKPAFGLNNSDVGNVHEYYASCFYAYCVNADKMQQTAPVSYQYITNDLEGI